MPLSAAISGQDFRRHWQHWRRRSTNTRKKYSFAWWILVAIAFQIWWLVGGLSGFNSDKAVSYLMRRRACLLGEWYPYYWGHSHYGFVPACGGPLLESLGVDVFMAYRIPFIPRYLIVIVLIALFVERMWGRRAMAYTLPLLTLPSALVLHFAGRLFFGSLIITSVLTLLFLSVSDTLRKRLVCAAVIGVLLGFAAWKNMMLLQLIPIVLLIALLRLPEWAVCSAAIDRSLRSIGAHCSSALRAGICGMLALCLYTNIVPGATVLTRSVASFILLGAGIVICTAVMHVSQRRRALVYIALAFLLGLLLGNMPQWLTTLAYDLTPHMDSMFSSPSQSSVAQTFLYLAQFWGNPLRRVAQFASLPGLAYAIALACIATYCWLQRHAIWALMQGKPLTKQQAQFMAVLLLLVIPVISKISHSSHTIASMRHIFLPAWLAAMMIVGYTLARLATYKQYLAAGAVCILLASSLFSYKQFFQKAQPYNYLFKPNVLEQIEDAMHDTGAGGGYADYWVAYGMTLLLQERYIFTEFNAGNPRFPFYKQQVDGLPRFVVLTRRQEYDNLGAIMQSLESRPDVLQRIAQAKLIEARYIKPYTLWVFESPAA